jgi:hypothetical protein
MIRIDPSRQLAEGWQDQLSIYARADYNELSFKKVSRDSERFWSAWNEDGEFVATGGIFRASLIDMPVCWFLTGAAFQKFHARPLAKQVRREMQHYAYLTAEVDTTYREGLALVQFLGFEPTPHTATHGSAVYRRFDWRR